MIIYIVGDNGASAEGGIEGSINENAFFNNVSQTWQNNIKVIDELGGPKHFNHFPAAWAWAMCTPFQWTKQVASHFCGTRNPTIVFWPAHAGFTIVDECFDAAVSGADPIEGRPGFKA